MLAVAPQSRYALRSSAMRLIYGRTQQEIEMKPIVRRWVNVGAFVVALLVNGLANVLPFGGRTTGEVSDQFNAVFTPAGYVFSIWSLIYLWLLAYVVYQALPKTADAPFQRQIGLLFAINMAANAAWMVCWHNLWMLPTVILMTVILITLLLIYVRLGTGVRHIKPLAHWLVRAPFSIYFGWICVATIANVSAYLIHIGWNGLGLADADWAVIMLLVGTLLSASISFLRRDYLFTAVIVWAFVGVFVQNQGVAGRNSAAIMALICAVLAAAGLVAGLIWGRRPRPTPVEPQ
jgi:hypothetical protein